MLKHLDRTKDLFMNLKNILYSFLPHNSHEVWKRDGSSVSWAYADNRREYEVISQNNQTVVKFDIHKKYNAELTLDGAVAQVVHTLLQKMGSPLMFPTKPIAPIKPMAPLILSFDSAATKEKKSNEYSKKLEGYIGECQKYDAELIDYNAKSSAYHLDAQRIDNNRKNLIQIIDDLFDQSVNLLREKKIPC